MVQILESKPVADVVKITESTRFDWPDKQELPTPTEFNRLNKLIASRYPALAANDAKEFQELWLAFLHLFFARRSEKPTRAEPSYWASICDDWLLTNNVPGRTSAKAIVAASILHGIPFTWPYISLGLVMGSRSTPQPSSWRKILADGLPAPVANPIVDRTIGTQQRSGAG